MTIGTVRLDHHSGHDAAHRGKIRSTHPTHGCIIHRFQPSGALIARARLAGHGQVVFAPFTERARRALRSLPC
jgi:hypothetical protein